MKRDVYRNAMNHLRYSEDLEKNVIESANPVRLRFRLVRIALISALICLLLGCGAYAAVNEWIRSEAQVDDLGEIMLDLFDGEVLEFTPVESLDGISVRCIALGRRNVSFINGYLYDPTEGFYRVTDSYELVAVESQTVSIYLNKNNKDYRLELNYIVTADSVVTNRGRFELINGHILVNAISADQWEWPVWLNITTGEYRDALPDLDENTFEGNVSGASNFRGDYLVFTLESRSYSTSNPTFRYIYWVSGDCAQIRKLDIPDTGVYDTVVNGILYYRDSEGYYYYMDEQFAFHRVEALNRTDDMLAQGLVAFQGDDGTLQIADVSNGVIYSITDLEMEYSDISIPLGYFAMRYSESGSIVLCRIEPWKNIATLAYLDRESGQLKWFEVYSGYELHGMSWLDDNRLCLMYSDGMCEYAYIYEFG